MNAAIDLANFHDMTDGNRELERQLYEEFLKTCNGFLETLETLVDGDNLEWRRTIHAMKGVSLNLGANHLADLCKKGQDAFESDAKTKMILLKEIHTAYTDVKTHISSLL